MCETVAGKSATNDLQILETFEERQQFTADLRGKRVLHVKGFGNSLRDSPEEEQGLDNKQEAEVLLAVQNFAPEFLVVDGDPWGEGFQMYMKQYIDEQQKIGRETPTLIWARSATLVGEHALLIDDEERNERLEQAKEWAAQGFPVVVYWVCMERINQQINKLFGHTFVEDNQAAQFDARGLVQIMADPLLPWVQGLAHDSHRSILSKWLSNFLLWSILAIESPDRGGKQYFQKCSFENAAMGNLIFDLLHSNSAAKHGVVCCGGGERVLLEIATKYLNQNFEALHEHVAIFPFSQGDDTEYPLLPKYMGLSFITRSYTLTHLSRHHPSNCSCPACFTEAVKSTPAISLELHIEEALESTPAHDPDTELLIEEIESPRVQVADSELTLKESIHSPLVPAASSELSIEEPVHAEDSALQMEETATVQASDSESELHIEEQIDENPAQATDAELCIEEQMDATPEQATDSELHVEVEEQMSSIVVQATGSELCVEEQVASTLVQATNSELPVEEQMSSTVVQATDSELHMEEQIGSTPVQATDSGLDVQERPVSTPLQITDSELCVEQQMGPSPVQATNSEQMDSTPKRMAGPDACIEENMDSTPATALDSELCIEEQIHPTPAPTTDSELCTEIVSTPAPAVDSEVHIKREGTDSSLPESSTSPAKVCIEGSVRAWIQAITGFYSGNQTMAEYLKDGQVLCALVNSVKPGTIKKVNNSKLAFKQMENITYFIKAARDLGVPEASMFSTSDLYEAKNMVSVFRCVYVFAGVVQVVCPEFSGPYLGTAIPPCRTDTKEKKRVTGQTAISKHKKALASAKIICSRPQAGANGSSSLTNLQVKISKVDVALERGICSWIEGVTMEVRGEQTMQSWLKSGEVLCRLANIVKPGLVQRINSGRVPFKQMENISFFRDAARRVGVPEFHMFRLLDLYEEKNMESVVSCLQAFADAVQANCPEFSGPILHDTLKPKVNEKKRLSTAFSQYEAQQRTMEEERP